MAWVVRDDGMAAVNLDSGVAIEAVEAGKGSARYTVRIRHLSSRQALTMGPPIPAAEAKAQVEGMVRAALQVDAMALAPFQDRLLVPGLTRKPPA